MNMPYDYDVDDLSKIKNNTIIGDHGDDNQEELLRNMLSKQMNFNLPGQTPMNTQMDEERD